jgi:hypothetical protein
VLVDFTDKRDDLLMAVNKMAIADEGLDDVNTDADASDTGSAFGEDDSEFNLFNTNRQLAALQTAVKMLGTLNEKKVLIYFSSGLQLNGIDNQAQFQATTNAAIRANTRVLHHRRARPGGAGAHGERHPGIAGRRGHVQ